MIKELSSSLSKFFTRDKVIIFVVLFVLVYALFAYSGSKGMYLDGMNDSGGKWADENDSNKEPSMKITNAQNVVPSAGMAPVTAGSYSPSAGATPDDLLPKDSNSNWSSLNPVANKDGIIMPDLLQAGYHIGLDTIGQTLRNANQQLRSDPIITKSDIGPWNQSTIEPDLGRTPLEIG